MTIAKPKRLSAMTRRNTSHAKTRRVTPSVPTIDSRFERKLTPEALDSFNRMIDMQNEVNRQRALEFEREGRRRYKG
ncbi:hypothetical protein LLG95_17965 [bacterium]|nr:hypothetical protein [bacterium]